MREDDVIDAVTQKNCAITQMKSRNSAHPWPIDSAQLQGTRKPRFSIAPSVLGIASVTASSSTKPKITEATTDMYMPTAAMREASASLLGHVRRRVEAGDRVLRHQEPRQEDVDEHEAAEVLVAGPEAGRVDCLAEGVAERLVVVGDDQQDPDDHGHADHVPVGRDLVQQRRDADVRSG